MENKKSFFRVLFTFIIFVVMTGQQAWAESSWTVSNSKGASNTFTIKRSEKGYSQKVLYRTVSLSAYAGQHYTAKYGELEFLENEDTKTVTVTESTPNVDSYKYQNGATRQYKLEVTDRAGLLLASATRDMTIGYNVASSGVFDNKSYTIRSSEVTVTEDGYAQSSNPHTVASTQFYTEGTKAYLVYLNAELRMRLEFQAKEVNDGYQYVQILTDNTTGCDTGAGDGNPGTPNVSHYMAGFDIGGKGVDTYYKYSFPVPSVGNDAGATKPWTELSNSVADLKKQKFNTGCRASDGRLILPTGFSTLVVRFNASGSDEDDWKAKDIKAFIQASDATMPTKLSVSAAPGRHAKGNTVYVSVAFSEIVTISGNTKKLTSSWGDLNYVAGSGTNVLTFSGIISNSASGTLSITGLTGTVQDLAGKGFTWSGTDALSTTLDGNLTYTINDFYTDGSGNYLIACHDDLWGLASYVNAGNNASGKTFLQVADISFAHTTNWNNASSTENNFSAIGSSTSIDYRFMGTYDGGGHSISGIRIYKDDTSNSDKYQGLFGYVQNGTVRNVNLADARITGHNHVGGIVGYSYQSTVEDCTVGDNVCIHAVQSDAKYHGGIMGYSNQNTVQRCISHVTLSVANNSNCAYYAGIVGSINSGTLSDCLAIGVVIPNVNNRGIIFGSKSNITPTRNYFLGCTGMDQSSNIFAITLGTNVTLNRTPATDPLPGTNNMTYNDGATIGGTEYYIKEAAIPLNYSGEVSTGYHLVYSATAGTISGSTLIMPAKDVTVTATVPANTYYVHFNKNGGVGEMVYQSFTYDVAQNLSTCTFSHSGEALAAWTTNADGTGTKYTNGQEVSNLTAENGAVIDLYAQWQHDWNFPEWTWTDNYSSATAHFTCLLCGETQNKQAFISAYPGENYLFSVEFGDEMDWYCGFTGNNALHQGQQTVQLNQPYYICSGAPGHYRIRCPEASFVSFYSLKEDDYSLTVEKKYSALLYRNSIEHYSDLEGNLDLNLNSDASVYGVVFYNQDRSDGEATVTIKGLTVHTAEIDPAVTGGTVSLTEKKYCNCNWSSTHKINEDNIVWLTFTPDEPLTDKGVVWTVTDVKGQNVPVQYHEGNSYFIMPAMNVTVSAKVGPMVSFIDADGNPQSHVCTPIESSVNEYGNSGNAEGWYCVNSDVNFSSAVDFLDQAVHIILCDGATFSSTIGNNNNNSISATNGSLTIYGQSLGTGIISASTRRYGIYAKTNIDLNGGTINATSPDNDGIFAENGTITLGWTRVTDRIYASSYKGTVVVKNGQTLTDGNAAYSGSVTASDINGKTLWPDLWDVAGGNDGSTAEKAYTITTTGGLDQLAAQVKNSNSTNNFVGKYFRLGADITYCHKADNEEGADTENNFTPIGTINNGLYRYFSGTFDGQGHTISGIRIYKGGDTDYDGRQGLFGMTSSATIKNVILADARITGRQDVGGIAGYFNGTVENCRVGNDVTIHAVANYASAHGGVVGFFNSGAIRGCVSASTLTVADGLTSINSYGGIVGNCIGNMSDCLAHSATVPAVTPNGAIAGNVGFSSTLTNNYYQDCTMGGNAALSNTYTVSAGTDVTVAPAGDADATYEYNGIKRYGDALYYGGVLYAPRDASVSLTLGYNGSVPTDLSVGYGASVGTLSGSANPYTLTMPARDVTINAFFGVEVPYNDEKGVEHIAIAIPLDNTMTTLAAGTYVVNSNVAYTSTVTTTGDVTLILADGCTMSFGSEVDPLYEKIMDCGGNLTIFGQTQGTGWLKAYNNEYYGILARSYTQYSGNVFIRKDGSFFDINLDFTLLGGTLDVESQNAVGNISAKYVSILGGQLCARRCNLNSYTGYYTLGRTNPTDLIYAQSYYSNAEIEITIADSQMLVDEYGNLFSGRIRNPEREIANRTLRPLIVSGVTVAKDGDYVATFDGTSTETVSIPMDVKVKSVIYNRTFTNGKCATLLLPFSLGDRQSLTGGTLYKFAGVAEENGTWVATMTETTTLKANTPYLILPNENLTDAKITFDLYYDRVTLNTTTAGEDSNDADELWDFIGTYEYKEWIADGANSDEIGKVYGFAGVAQDGINVGDFVKVASGAKIRPMSAYLKWKGLIAQHAPGRGMTHAAANEEELPSRITVRLLGADGTVTNVGEIDMETGEVSFDGWYTLQGVKLNAEPTEPGIYINNGKKVSITH